MRTAPLRPSLASVLLGLLGLITPACGDSGETGPSASATITKLPDDEVLALCLEFISKACAAGIYTPGEPVCDACQPCDQPGSLAIIRARCGSSITVGDVRDCIDSGFDAATCTGAKQGGCLFDVADELCR